MKRPSPTRNRILLALHDFGRMTVAEIAEHTGLSESAVTTSIRCTRENWPGTIYIAEYRRNYGRRGKPSPIFAVGKKPDAAMPKSDRLADKARYREKSRELIRLKNQRRNGTEQSPWLRQLQGNLSQWSRKPNMYPSDSSTQPAARSKRGKEKAHAST